MENFGKFDTVYLGRPFVKRGGSLYALRPWSVLPVTLLRCIVAKRLDLLALGTEVGLGPGDVVLYRESASSHHRNGHSSPYILVYAYRG